MLLLWIFSRYMVAFLGMFLDTPILAGLVIRLGQSPLHSLGYFKAVPERFVADARAMFSALEVHMPAMATHVKSKGIVPEMFATKWFVGLGLHVLPFEVLDGIIVYVIRRCSIFTRTT